TLQGTAVQPEINVQGNSTSITDGDVTPATADNTDFGTVTAGSTQSKTFVIQNTGTSSLSVTGISFSGTNASEFYLFGGPAFPLSIAASSSQAITVQFAPVAAGTRTATISIVNSDSDESIYDFALQGLSVAPEINLEGNSVSIADGDATPSATDNTDFGSVNTGGSLTKTFMIQNTGTSSLSVSGISFSGANASEFTLLSAPSFPLNIPAAGLQTITIQFAPSAAGNRMASVNIFSTDSDEASYNFNLQGIATAATGINTLMSSASIQVYPNPAGDKATVDILLEQGEHIVVRVYDIQGKEIGTAIEKDLSKGQHQITLNTSGYEDGVYFVQVSSSTGEIKIKTVVKH
ncbi:MAG: choice-of-anchor D domain-containing protein, partial [Cytophagaceae bacterium]